MSKSRSHYAELNFNLRKKTQIISTTELAMAEQFCSYFLKEVEQLVYLHGSFLLAFCVLDLTFSLVATIGNLLALRGLWKASSIPVNIKTFFLSLTFTDLAVGLFAQVMRGVIIAVTLKTAANGNYDFGFLCPASLTVCYFSLFLLAGASYLNVTAIAVDRLLAISLHLRYQELVISKRVTIALVSLWIASAVSASIFVSLHDSRNNILVAVIFSLGFLLTSVAYIRIYRVLRYHQRQIQSQFQHRQNSVQVLEQMREIKSAFNTLFVYVVFIACYLPYWISTMILIRNSSQVSSWTAYHAIFFFVFLNSSINPLV